PPLSTRFPYTTLFRSGAVRCGSCLHIFNARENWLDDKTAAKAAEESAARPNTVRSINSEASKAREQRQEPVIDDDALFDDDTPLFDDEDEQDEEDRGRSIFNPGDADFVPEKTEEESLFGDFMEESDWLTPNKISFDDKVEDDDAQDDSWAESLLADDGNRGKTDENNDTEDFLDDRLQPEHDAGKYASGNDFQFDHDDILAQAPVSSEANEDAGSHEEFLDIPSAFDPGLRPAPKDDELPANAADEPTEIVYESDNSSFNTSFNAGDRIGTETPLAGLRGLKTEPIRPHQFVQESRWPKLLWGLGFVVAAAALPAQYLYFNFAHLARGDLRPWLAQACDIVGCRLPAQSDP